MKTRTAAWLFFAAITAPALAQPYTLYQYEARRFDPTNNTGWSSKIDALPGDRIEVRTLLTLVNPGTIAGGLRLIAFQPIISGGLNWEQAGGDNLLANSDLGLTDARHMANGIGPIGGDFSNPISPTPDQPGAYGRISPFAFAGLTTSTFLRGHLGTGTAAGLLRIAQAHITNWVGVGPTSGPLAANNYNAGSGVNLEQPQDSFVRPAGSAPFDGGQTRRLVFKFAFELSATPGARTVSITTPANGLYRTLQGSTYVDNSSWYNSVVPNALDFTRMSGVVEEALIQVIPAPGALPIAGIMLAVGRRRRRALSNG